MEYINTLVEAGSVSTTPKDIPKKGDLISKGVDFTDNKPSFVIDVPNKGAIVRNVKVPSSNVAEIEVVFTKKSGGEPVRVRGAPTSLPTDKFPKGKVTKIVVNVIKTTDDKAPQDVTLSVIACAEASTTTKAPGNISPLSVCLSLPLSLSSSHPHPRQPHPQLRLSSSLHDCMTAPLQH